MNTIEIKLVSHSNITVNFRIDGKYIAATYFNPPEYPEIEIVSVIYNGRDIIGLLSMDNIDDIVEYIDLNYDEL